MRFATKSTAAQAVGSGCTEKQLAAMGRNGTKVVSRVRIVCHGNYIEAQFLKVYSYCSPETARRMVDFSPAMAAFMPCRMTLLERDDGSLWIYTLNMDMMVKMGRKLPSPLKEEALHMRDTIWLMLERGAKGEF